MLAETWVSDIRTWPAPVPEDDDVTLLASALNSLPRRFGREMSLRLPVSDHLKLPRLLLGIELLEGSPAIWNARMIKTAAEVVRIRAACQIACDTYEPAPSLVQTIIAADGVA